MSSAERSKTKSCAAEAEYGRSFPKMKRHFSPRGNAHPWKCRQRKQMRTARSLSNSGNQQDWMCSSEYFFKSARTSLKWCKYNSGPYNSTSFILSHHNRCSCCLSHNLVTFQSHFQVTARVWPREHFLGCSNNHIPPQIRIYVQQSWILGRLSMPATYCDRRKTEAQHPPIAIRTTVVERSLLQGSSEEIQHSV